MRHPDMILSDWDTLVADDVDDVDAAVLKGRELLWEVIEDVLHSVHLAETNRTGNESLEVWATVENYVANHYGDD